MTRSRLPLLTLPVLLFACTGSQQPEAGADASKVGSPPPATPNKATTSITVNLGEQEAPLPPPPPAPQQSEQPAASSSLPESAFDSNQWNSAVGLGGSAGGRYGGRMGGRSDSSTESYAGITTSGYLLPDASPLSTFAADVDTASFTNVLRYLQDSKQPPIAAVRLEEFVNAMRYELAPPAARETFSIDTEVANCPWNDAHELVRIAVRTKEIATDKLPPCNLVFLVDVSGSMQAGDKLPLLKRAFGLLIEQLRPQDHVSIVTYASGVKVALDDANGGERARIQDALAKLTVSGGTNGAGGIQAAYDLALRHKVAGVNRVLLATDGDFNVGISSPDALEQFITAKKDLGVFLSVLGFGTGNLKDDRLERLANRGNGVYSYIADLAAARRALVEQFGASMMCVAKDVKLQTEWDRTQVARYRLLGYENRTLASQDFADDKKDGGEVGAGHSVTALYEIERVVAAKGAANPAPLATLRIRYKPPEGDTSREVTSKILPGTSTVLSQNGQVAATAAAIALHLRQDDHRGNITPATIAALTQLVDKTRNPELHACNEALQALPVQTAAATDVAEK